LSREVGVRLLNHVELGGLEQIVRDAPQVATHRIARCLRIVGRECLSASNAALASRASYPIAMELARPISYFRGDKRPG